MPFLQVDDDTLARLKELHRKRSLGVATGLAFPLTSSGRVRKYTC